MRADYLSLVESIYALGQPEKEWLEGISAAAEAVLERGSGVSAFAYDASDPAALSFSTITGTAGWNRDEAQTETQVQAIGRARPEVIKRLYWGGPPVTFARKLVEPRDLELFEPMLRRLGIFDALGVRGHDPSGRGAMIVVPLRASLRLPSRQRATLNRIATHLAAAFRLRSVAPALETAEALFDTRGGLLHVSEQVEGRALPQGLKSGVARMLGGKQLRREDPERAVALWSSLIAGHFSVFDQFDSDGKRFLVARRNEPNVSDPRALSPEERRVACYAAWGHSQKLISYELGISSPTVSHHLKQALRKLGLRHRAELVGVFGGAPESAALRSAPASRARAPHAENDDEAT
jgi:DNA-binding CsgD family transcriptional regulator